ncbi:MAG: hypothetical protein ACRD5L_01305, partial [Bryobacteraceae bacterium]
MTHLVTPDPAEISAPRAESSHLEKPIQLGQPGKLEQTSQPGPTQPPPIQPPPIQPGLIQPGPIQVAPIQPEQPYEPEADGYV